MLTQIFKYLIGAKDVEIHKCGRKRAGKYTNFYCVNTQSHIYIRGARGQPAGDLEDIGD